MFNFGHVVITIKAALFGAEYGKDDVKFLLECRNDTLTRKQSHNSDLIDEDKHLKWLDKSIAMDGKQVYLHC